MTWHSCLHSPAINKIKFSISSFDLRPSAIHMWKPLMASFEPFPTSAASSIPKDSSPKDRSVTAMLKSVWSRPRATKTQGGITNDVKGQTERKLWKTESDNDTEIEFDSEYYLGNIIPALRSAEHQVAVLKLLLVSTKEA